MEIKDIATFFKGPIDKLTTLVGNEIQQTFSSRLLEYQVEEYKRNFFSKTILHRAEPKALNEFYQPLFIRLHKKILKAKRFPQHLRKNS